ncbi:MAG TPA: SH3 domain-containing protein [Roseiflexaceae bacterium]|nr:SH3 domain-containing protein [Roseiflexaceae bacterium]
MQSPAPFIRKLSVLIVALSALAIGQPGTTQAAPAHAGGDALKSALLKTAPIAVYRMVMDMSATGALASGLGGAASEAPDVLPVLTMAAEVNNKDAHFTMKGLFSSFMGADPGVGVEFITVAGKNYVHGPLPMIGANENRWYVTTDAQAFGSLAQSQDLAALARVDLSAFSMVGSEALDGRKCDIYGSSDKNAIAQIFQSFSPGALTGANSMEGMDSAELKFWICDDGYFHKMFMSFEGADKTNPANTGGIAMSFHIYDFNSAIKIVAPADAAPLEQPKLDGSLFETLPTSAASGALIATVFNGGNIRQSPSPKGQVLGQMHAHQTVGLLAKTVDGRWYQVSAPEATGWVHVSLLRISPDVASRVFVNGEASVSAPATEQLFATVINGGNRRAAPSMKAEVLGQVRAGDTIQLLAKTKGGAWYYARCRCGALGWVHASLLKVDPKVARKIPIA